MKEKYRYNFIKYVDLTFREIATKIAENIGWVLEGKLPLNCFNPDLTF